MYIPLKLKSHYSLLESSIRPDRLVKKLKTLGFSACALTDTRNISGAVDFSQTLKKAKIKPILGSEILLSDAKHYITCIAKNKNGWNNLIKLISRSNDPDRLEDDKPALRLSDFADVKDMICLLDYSLQLDEIKEIFGKDNVFLTRNSDLAQNTKVVATPNPYYLDKTDSYDHKVLMCSYFKTTYNKLSDVVGKSNNMQMKDFLLSDDYYLPNPDEFKLRFTDEQIENTHLVNSMCEDYSITGKPRTPTFDCPNGLSEIDYLKALARQGYTNKKKDDWDAKVYGDRAKLELDTIERVGLAGYFQDYVNWAKSNRCLVGPARGSSAGSLTAYLTGITTVDPIPYDLLWERFYNEGRNSADKVSFPDIDIDFPIKDREKVIEYIKNKYGKDRVGHITTFGRMQGRGALKEVLRVHNVCDVDTMNKITKGLPQEHEIADKLEEEQEESIIRWTLENEPQEISDYCKLEDGVMVGDFAQYFEQAARLEGVFRSQGKHAAGIIISAEPLHTMCPMIADKSSNEKMIGYEMDSAEATGGLKFDMLGVAGLDKLSYANELLKG